MPEQWYRNTHNLQVDITSYCNARCSGCVRNKDGDEVKEELILEHFDLEVWERLAKEDTAGWYIATLTLNGNWGDPMMHPHLVKMLAIWSLYHPESAMYLHTNGSMRTTKFWEDMGEVCRQFTNHFIVFSIDGMHDTHNIYRRKTDLNKILENIKAFTSKGGRGIVTMTLFEHNKHQVKQVEALAKTTGVFQFNLRHSHGTELLVKTKDDGDYYVNASDEIDEYQVEFKENRDALPIMSKQRDYDIFLDVSDKLQEEAKQSSCACPWYNDKSVQIDPWGKVWPCCHVSLYGTYIEGHTLNLDVDQSFLRAREMNNLKKFSLSEILKNEWFTETVPDAVHNGSWNQCKRICGVEGGV